MERNEKLAAVLSAVDNLVNVAYADLTECPWCYVDIDVFRSEDDVHGEDCPLMRLIDAYGELP